jgi:hypothetical protein
MDIPVTLISKVWVRCHEHQAHELVVRFVYHAMGFTSACEDDVALPSIVTRVADKDRGPATLDHVDLVVIGV